MTRPYAGGTLVAEVVRSGFVEGRHYGSVVILGPDGAVVASAGDPDGPVFPRSSNKPMQLVGMVRAGLVRDDPADLAIAAGSHTGEPMHIDRVRAMLASGGLTEDDLLCPPDLPESEAARTELLRADVKPAPVYMNCSGKHSAMLLTSRANDWPLVDYRSPDHPVQRACRTAVTYLAGEDIAAEGVDGCGAVVMAISLTGLARAFLRLADAPAGSVERRVADAMRAYPELVSGTAREDARLMRGVPGLLTKGGAEAVHALALPGVGAIAIKIDDGAVRARGVVVAAALRFLGVDAPVVDEMASPIVKGGGLPVGQVRAVPLFAAASGRPQPAASRAPAEAAPGSARRRLWPFSR